RALARARLPHDRYALALTRDERRVDHRAAAVHRAQPVHSADDVDDLADIPAQRPRHRPLFAVDPDHYTGAVLPHQAPAVRVAVALLALRIPRNERDVDVPCLVIGQL